MDNTKTVELQVTDLFEELDDADLASVSGGATDYGAQGESIGEYYAAYGEAIGDYFSAYGDAIGDYFDAKYGS